VENQELQVDHDTVDEVKADSYRCVVGRLYADFKKLV
jgi:hypothetical protein